MIVVDVCAPLPSVPYDSATPEDLAETVSLIEKTGRPGDLRHRGRP